MGPNPIVSKREILRVLDPRLRGSPRARFQTLRNKGVVSMGVVRPLAGRSGRLRGSVHLFSTLNRDAVRLHRLGRDADARKVAKDAKRLEEQAGFVRLVDLAVAFANSREQLVTSLGDTPWQIIRQMEAMDQSTRRLLMSVATAAEHMRQAYRAAEDISRLAGWVISIQERMAEIETITGTMAMLPTIQLESLGLDRIGAALEVEWEEVDPGEVIVSTVAAVGSRDCSSENRSAFAPPKRLVPSQTRWAAIRRKLDNPTPVPSVPLELPART